MKTWLRLTLITMTVGGGFTGVVLTFQSMLHPPDDRMVPYLAAMTGFLALFVFVTVSGLLFVHDPRRTGPLLLAVGIQVPWTSSGLVLYKFATGCYWILSLGAPQTPGLVGARVNSELLLGSAFRFDLLHEHPWGIGVNAVALTLFLLLWISVRTPSSNRAETVSARVSSEGQKDSAG